MEGILGNILVFTWKYAAAVLVVIAIVPMLQTLSKLLSWLKTVLAQTQAASKLPGPKKHWFWGHLLLLPAPSNGQEFVNISRKWTEQFPYVSTLFIGWWQTYVMLRHPDPIKKILKTSEPKPMSSGAGYNLMIPWLGDGLLLSSGPKWFRNRKLLTPGFHFDVLKPYMAIYNRAAETMIKKWDKESVTGGSIEIYRPVSKCTLDVMLRCAFSYESDVQLSDNRYVNNVTSMTEFLIDRGLKPWLYLDLIYYMTSNGRKFKEYCNYAHEIANELILKRQKLLAEQNTVQDENKRYVDFLDILLLAKDGNGKGLTNEEIREEVDTFLFEGHDTTASGVSWILYELAKHQDIQERCRAELSGVLNGKDFGWEHLQKIPFTTQCIKEGLRLHPPVPFVLRELTESMEIHGQNLLPGTKLLVSIFNLHHNPVVWGPDADDFKPERFSIDNMKNMDSHAFCPFSAGPRNCIGQNFAMNEMKVAVSRVLCHFQLSVDEKHPIEQMPFVTTKPKHGIKLYLKPLTS